MRLRLLVPIQTRLCDSPLSWSQELGGEREGGQEEEDHGGHDNRGYGLNLFGLGVTDNRWLEKNRTNQEEELPSVLYKHNEPIDNKKRTISTQLNAPYVRGRVRKLRDRQ